MSLVKDISRREWRDFIQQHPTSSLFQRPEMFDVHVRSHGFVPHVFGSAGADGELTALLAWSEIYLTKVPLPFSGRILVVDGPVGSEAHTSELLGAIDDTAWARATYSEIRNLTEPRSRAAFETSGYRWEDHVNYILDLDGDERRVLDGMTKHRRHEIKLAEAKGVDLVNLGLRDLERTEAILKKTYRRARMPLADRTLFEAAFQVLGPQNAFVALGARFAGSICSVLLLLRWNGTVYNWYMGSTEEGRSNHANAWLLWQGIRKAIHSGASRFDFGGGGQPGAHYGPGDFKRRFGGTEIHPGRFRRVYHPLFYRLSFGASGLWRNRG